MPDVVLDLGDPNAHAHQWKPVETDESGLSSLECECGATATGYIGTRLPHRHVWEATEDAETGVHEIRCDCGESNTCDCRTLPDGHPSQHQHPKEAPA